ncbi:MAG: MerR family transcriptional regulator [Bacteroidota bacterium]
MSNTKTQINFEFSEDNPPQQNLPTAPSLTSPGEYTAPQKPKRGRRNLKQMEDELEKVEVPEDEILFAKQYWSIGEVSGMFKVNTSLIRYWENEFDVLEPRKNRKGDRFFKPTDVKNLELIHDLLRRRKFTIEGAKDYIKKNSQAGEKHTMVQSLQKIRSFLLEVKANL